MQAESSDSYSMIILIQLIRLPLLNMHVRCSQRECESSEDHHSDKAESLAEDGITGENCDVEIATSCGKVYCEVISRLREKNLVDLGHVEFFCTLEAIVKYQELHVFVSCLVHGICTIDLVILEVDVGALLSGASQVNARCLTLSKKVPLGSARVLERELNDIQVVDIVVELVGCREYGVVIVGIKVLRARQVGWLCGVVALTILAVKEVGVGLNTSEELVLVCCLFGVSGVLSSDARS